MTGFEVMSRDCGQCLMTPRRIVSKKRAAELLAKCQRENVHFVCHKGSLADREIACHLHHATRVGQMSRIAERLGMVVRIDPDTLEEVTP